MKFRIPQNWLYEFSERLLREADISPDVIEHDLHEFVYEAGERGWDGEEGENFFYIDYDFDDD